MKLSDSVNAYVRPRWARWLRELSVLGVDADLLRKDLKNRDSSPRAGLALWVDGKRTVSPANAFFVGQRVAAEPRLAGHGDPSVAVYAAGYLNVVATCLQVTIDRALEAYPHKSKVATLGVADYSQPVVRELTYALVAAVGIPFALAHIDGIPDARIPPDARSRHLKVVLNFSEPRFFDDAWATRVSRHGAQLMPASNESGLTLADQEALAWSGFVNRLSRRAQQDPILQLHFSTLREQVDSYQKIVFRVPHHKPRSHPNDRL